MKQYMDDEKLRKLNDLRRGKKRTVHIECPNCDIELWIPRGGTKACGICGYTRTILLK